MVKGQSNNSVNDIDNPNHKLIKALRGKGYLDVVLVFNSKFSRNAGWFISGCSNRGLVWLGFNIDEALLFIKGL
jgi:hypothetical protein